MLCHTALARQAAPAAGLGLLFGPVLVGCCPLVRSYRVGTSRPLALLGCCHGLTVTHINAWPGVGQGPCMQHTCVHSAMRMGTHASVSLAGCHDSDTAGTCPHTHTGTHPHVSEGTEGERSTARHGPAVLQINLRCTRVRVHVQREACARACVRVWCVSVRAGTALSQLNPSTAMSP